MKRNVVLVAAVAVLASLATGGTWLARPASSVLGAEGAGSVAGWVYWGFCGAYAYGGAQAGTGAAPPDQPKPAGPVIVYPEPSPQPAIGALVALQGTNLAAQTDEEGFFWIEGVPLGTYFTVVASWPRRRVQPMAESGRPTTVRPGPVVCVSSSSLRGNVVVTDANRPANVGALILARYGGPRPLGPNQSAPEGEEDEEP